MRRFQNVIYSVGFLGCWGVSLSSGLQVQAAVPPDGSTVTAPTTPTGRGAAADGQVRPSPKPVTWFLEVRTSHKQWGMCPLSGFLFVCLAARRSFGFGFRYRDPSKAATAPRFRSNRLELLGSVSQCWAGPRATFSASSRPHRLALPWARDQSGLTRMGPGAWKSQQRRRLIISDLNPRGVGWDPSLRCSPEETAGRGWSPHPSTAERRRESRFPGHPPTPR